MLKKSIILLGILLSINFAQKQEKKMANLKLHSFVLFVDDIAKSRNFYENILNQELVANFGDINIGYKSGLGLWQRKYAHNIIYKTENPENSGSKNSELYLETDNLDAIFEKINQNNVKILHPIVTQPWLQRGFRIYDPDNFIVEISESMEEVVKRLIKEGMPLKEISEKTYMPIEYINSLIDKK